MDERRESTEKSAGAEDDAAGVATEDAGNSETAELAGNAVEAVSTDELGAGAPITFDARRIEHKQKVRLIISVG